jgi:hypothetical protein
MPKFAFHDSMYPESTGHLHRSTGTRSVSVGQIAQISAAGPHLADFSTLSIDGT